MPIKHLRDQNLSWGKHLKNAWTFSAKSLYASVAFFIHGIFPFTFERTGSKVVNDLNTQITTMNSTRVNSGITPMGRAMSTNTPPTTTTTSTTLPSTTNTPNTIVPGN